MKLTRENLKTSIDMYHPHMSGEEVFINLVGYIIVKYPHLIPELSKTLAQAYANVFENQYTTLHFANERAKYLESYLSGTMYPEKVAQKPEYINIQRGHATEIKERTAKALGE